MQLTQGDQRKRESCQVLTLMQNFKIPSTVLDQALTKQVVREQASQVGVRNKNRLLEKTKTLGCSERKANPLRQELLELLDRTLPKYTYLEDVEDPKWSGSWNFSKMLSMPLAGWYPFSFTKIFKSIVKVLFNRSISPRTGVERLPDAVQKP